MKVAFYGHVRQYHNIKAEIDANIKKVLESGQYVMGPMLKQFESELAAYHGTKYAVGVGNGTDAIWLAAHGAGHRPGRRSHHPPEHLLRHRRGDLDRRRHGRLRRLRPDDQVHRPGEDRGGHHARRPRPSSPSTSTASAPTWRPSSKIADKHKLLVIEDNAQAIGARGRRASRSASSATRSPPASSSRRTSAPSATAARWSPTTRRSTRTVRKLRNHGSTSAQRPQLSASTAAWTTSTPASSAPSSSTSTSGTTCAASGPRATPRASRAARPSTCPYELPGYRHVFHLYVIETKKPEQRDQLLEFLVENGVDAKTPLLDRHPPAGRLSVGQGRAHRRLRWPTPSATPPPASRLPMFPELTAEEVDYVIAKVMEWDKANA